LKVPYKNQHIEGILGLGYGKASILSQLKSQDLIQNVVGHCIKKGGGYIFFGDKFIPKSPTQISWTPNISPSMLVNDLIDVATHTYIYYTQL
jgi:hypothetical protein